MLIGVMGDIHGNIDALQAMTEHFIQKSVDRILCAGDVVGYGGAPGDCVDYLETRQIACVCGNHDFYTIHPEMKQDGIREEAQEVFAWNRKVLTNHQLRWLEQLPMYLVSKRHHFEVRHASCQPYPAWEYVVDDHRAAMNFLFQQSRVCFNAHSHVPILGMHRPGEHVEFRPLESMTIPTDRNVLIGVGAVGQPRDGDPRACGVIYDTETNTILVERVDYDIQTAQKRIIDAGLPPFLAERLAIGR